MEQSTHNRPQVYSERQRVVVITFDTPADAQEWDDAGQPLDGIPLTIAPGEIESEFQWLMGNSDGVVGLRVDGQPMPWVEVRRLYMPRTHRAVA